MSRPRSIDKTYPISVSLPLSIIEELNLKLSYNQSRSKWIQKAIKNRLNDLKESQISNYSNIALMCYLRDRPTITKSLSNSLQQEIDFILKQEKNVQE